MEIEDRRFYMTQIVSGYVMCSVAGEDVLIGAPSPIAKVYAEKAYKQVMRKSELLGVMSAEQKKQILMSIGGWNPIEESEYEKIPKEIENIKINLYQAYSRYKHRDAIRKKLNNKKKRYLHLIRRRDQYAPMTVEGLASIVKQKYLICGATHTLDGKPYWEGLSFLQHQDWFINELLSQYAKAHIDDDIVREIANTEPWRSIWASAKSEGSVFGRPSCELTELQRSLIVWSRVYDSIYESMECPPDEVIEDNDMIDGWLLLQSRKRQQERVEGHGTGKKKGGFQEEFVMVENAEDAARVEALNSVQSKMVKAQRMRTLQKHGKLAEQYMPDSKMKIREQARSEAMKHMKRGRR